MRKHGQNVYHLGQWTTPAVERTSPSTGAAAPPAKDNLIPVVPGAEAAVLGDLPEAVLIGLARGGVVLVGERAAEVPGLYSAVSALAARTGAVVGWVPRRAGERGALDAGAAPTLLPGGRAVADAAARAAVEAVWGLTTGALPTAPGRDTDAILAAAGMGELAALVVGGLDPYDLADPAAALAGLREVGFLVSLEMLRSPVTELADVVLPVAPDAQRAGTYHNWEGRARSFGAALDASGVLPDCRVLDTLAVEMDVDLFTQTPAAAAGEFARLGLRTGVAPAAPKTSPRAVRARPASGRPCWPPGASSSTVRRSHATSRTSRARPGPRSCGSTRPPPGGWGSPRASPPRCAPSGAPSRCRWRWPTCPTAWCGCRATPANPGSAPCSASATATWWG